MSKGLGNSPCKVQQRNWAGFRPGFRQGFGQRFRQRFGQGFKQELRQRFRQRAHVSIQARDHAMGMAVVWGRVFCG